MINFEVFCPYERVAAHVARFLKANNFQGSHFDMDLGGINRTFFLSRGLDQDLGLEVSERQRLQSTPVLEGRITLYEGDRFETRVLRVEHDLLTSSAVSTPRVIKGKTCYNGTIGRRKVFYPEAYYTVAASELQTLSAPEVVNKTFLRPWWNYLFFCGDDGVYLVKGPACCEPEELQGHVVYKSDLCEDVVFTSSDVIGHTMVEDVQIEKVNDVNASLTSKISFVYEGEEYAFDFGQVAASVAGKRLKPEVTYAALLLSAHYEMAGGSQCIELIDCEGELGILKYNEIMSEVRTSRFLTEAREYVSYSDYDVFVRRGANTGSLIWHATNGSAKSNQSCFALSIARLLAASSPTPFYTLLYLIVDNIGKMIDFAGGHLVGVTSRFDGGTANIIVRQAGIASGETISRARVDIEQLEEGQWALLGLEYNPDNDEPDHWIVVRKSQGRLRVVFDPLVTARLNVGTDVTTLADVKGAMLLSFRTTFNTVAGLIGVTSGVQLT